jgi:DNA mismatch repair protein MutL
MIEDLFFNVPARLKFLKSAQTEFYYCYNYFVDVALWHHDKYLIFKKNDKIIFDLEPTRTVLERIDDIFKKKYSKNLNVFEKKEDDIVLSGIVSDPSLRFGSGENIRIYVNKRPVSDKIIRRALLDAYQRQLHPGEFPFVILMLEMDPLAVDVNVHPKKSEVKFSDSRKIYNLVYNSIVEVFGDNKIAVVDDLEPKSFQQKQFVG